MTFRQIAFRDDLESKKFAFKNILIKKMVLDRKKCHYEAQLTTHIRKNCVDKNFKSLKFDTEDPSFVELWI